MYYELDKHTGEVTESSDPASAMEDRWMLQEELEIPVSGSLTLPVRVSTVFLGTDHGLHYGSDPVVFETALLCDQSSRVIKRYTSMEEARTTHRRAIRRLLEHYRAEIIT